MQPASGTWDRLLDVRLLLRSLRHLLQVQLDGPDLALHLTQAPLQPALLRVRPCLHICLPLRVCLCLRLRLRLWPRPAAPAPCRRTLQRMPRLAMQEGWSGRTLAPFLAGCGSLGLYTSADQLWASLLFAANSAPVSHSPAAAHSACLVEQASLNVRHRHGGHAQLRQEAILPCHPPKEPPLSQTDRPAAQSSRRAALVTKILGLQIRAEGPGQAGLQEPLRAEDRLGQGG